MFNWLISEDDQAGIDFQVDKNKCYRYEANSSNHFKLNEMIMNKCENHIIVEVSVLSKVDEGFIFDWTVKKKNLYKGMEYLGEHLLVLERLAGIKDHLRLLVNKNGQIAKVLNKDEIHNNWLDIKRSLYKDDDWPIGEEHRIKFIEDGDREHSLNYPLEKVLNQDPVFATFFFQNTKNKTKEGDDALVRVEEYSNLLMSGDAEKCYIPLIQNANWKKNQDNEGFIDFVISRNADKGRLNKKQMNKLLKNFPFAEQEIKSYIYSYEAEYLIDGTSFMITEAKYDLLEKVNQDLEVSHFCNIKLLS